MTRILLMEGGQIRPVESTRFLLEARLHDYLEQFPELLPFEDVEDHPPRIKVIGREVGVPSGSIDLLLLDSSGRVTIVETKLARNPEVRREVIGQIVEYASYLTQWSYDQLEREAVRYFAKTGKTVASLHEAIAELGEAVLREDFASQVEENLRRGRIRLVVAIDELVESLRSTVNFLNAFSSFDIVVLQLRDFELEPGRHVFMPSVFGYKPAPPPSRIWERERFLQQVAQKYPANHEVMEKLIAFCESEDAIRWGRGRRQGTFGFSVPGRDGRTPDAFGATGAGKVFLDFGVLANWLDEDLVKQYRDGLRKVQSIPRDAIEAVTWREFDAALLDDEDFWTTFADAVRALRTATSARYASES